MALINDKDYPEIFMDCLNALAFSGRNSDYFVTELIDAPRIVQLKKRHSEDFERLASSALTSFFGNAVHSQIERGLNRVPNELYLCEKKIRANVLNRVVAGKYDCYHNGIVYDFKTTSVWKYMFGDTKEWENQLNIYYYLISKYHKLDVKGLEIIAFFRDFKQMESLRNSDYPKKEVVSIKLPLWDLDTAEDYFMECLKNQIKWEEVPDELLPECTEEDMWEKPTKYAVYQKGLKRAKRVLDSNEDAEKWIEDSKLKNLYIDVRPGERMRCNKFCDCAPFCNQHQDYLKECEENAKED